jgi:twinkle protein
VGEFIGHEPCSKCGSSDGLARYADGSSFCFACHTNFPADGAAPSVTPQEPKDWKPIKGNYQDLTKRGIKEETCRKWKYETDIIDGVPTHIMNIFDDGVLIAQKLRTPTLKGKWKGDGKDPPFYGQWLWSKGKHLVITEGEIDALSVSQAMENKWPVVSLPNGSGSVAKTIKRSYDWLGNFDNIVLMFDMDEPGRAAVEEAVELLPPGKVKIASLPAKDANEVLLKHGPGAILQAFWNAPLYRPDGIISGEDITLEELMTEASAGYELKRTPLLQEKLLGLRKGEITLLTAGSGIGKSTWARELAYDLFNDYGLRLGNVFLEEGQVKTAQGYVALHHGVPLGRLRHNKDLLTREQWQEAHEQIIKSGRLFFYRHFGSLESNRLLSKLHYLATVEKVDFIVLDHISIVTSGLESSSEGERKDIDILMTKLRSLVEETGVGILAIVHLKRVPNKSFNEGAQVSLSDLRGSASLEQLSDNVLALERNQQGEGDKRSCSLIRVLKTREGDDTGPADTLMYNRKTGRNDLVSPFEAGKQKADDAEAFKF